MPQRDAPDYMNRLAISILFQDQHAGPFRIIRIVFDNDGCGQTVDDVANKDLVCTKFLITVIGHADVATSHERPQLVEGLAQVLDLFLFLIISSDGSSCPANGLPLSRRVFQRSAPAAC